MKKQVIIDKGNGLQQRLSYDDSTNKIIPELNIGPNLVDNVLPIVGNKFIKDTGLGVAYGEDCIYCKGKTNTSGIPFDTQCAVLSGITPSYSQCYGKVHQTTYYKIDYNGIKFGYDDKYSIIASFYDTNNILIRKQGLYSFDFPYFFFLHQNSVNKVTFQLQTWNGIKYTDAECILTMKNGGVITPLELYKDPSAMTLIVDKVNHGYKYINNNPSKNLNYIDVLWGINNNSDDRKRYFHNKIYSFYDWRFSRTWFEKPTDRLIGNLFYSSRQQFVGVFGFEAMNNFFGCYSNALNTTDGHLVVDPNQTGDNPKGGEGG